MFSRQSLRNVGFRVAGIPGTLAPATRGRLPFASFNGVEQPLFVSVHHHRGTLHQVLLRGLPTRDDRVQEDRVLIFDVGLRANDEDALPCVTVGVRLLQDVEQIAALDVKDEILEPDAPLLPELRVLRVVPGEAYITASAQAAIGKASLIVEEQQNWAEE